MKHIILLMVMVIANLAFAGGWVIGGGELIGDVINPWFLNNSTQIRYCVLVDEVRFGLSQSQSEQIVENGLKFWIRQFTDLAKNDSEIPIGQQVFIKETCQSTTDLKFQFGELEIEQLQKLPSMDRKIAVSVRTDYDTINMRAKGFIYISPEKGPLAIRSNRIEVNPWSRSQGLLTELVLIHELGHIFGLHHNSTIPIMKEDFVEFILLKGVLAYYKPDNIKNDLDTMSLFKIGKTFQTPESTNCFLNTGPVVRPINKSENNIINNLYSIQSDSDTNMLTTFFGLNFEPSCYSSQTIIKNGQRMAELFFWDQKGNKTNITVPPSDSYTKLEIESLLKVFLPKDQIVFKKDINTNYKRFGSVENELSYSSVITNAKTGINHPVKVTLYNERSPIITGEYNGKIYLDILNGW